MTVGPEAARETRTFLQAIAAGKPDEMYILVWTGADKQSHWFRDVESAIRFVASHPTDVYVGAGLSGQDRGPWNRCENPDVAGLLGLWADVDIKSDAHPKETLPPTIEEALKILPPELPPTVTIDSGNGVQAWWLFREPFIIECDNEREEIKKLSRRWQLHLQLDAAASGFSYDPLADLARVMRIAGTLNGKDHENLKPVQILTETDRRYNPSDILEFLDDLGVPDAAEHGAAVQVWKDKFAESPLTIDLSATVPEDQLAHYCATDKRFEITWRRFRNDLKDQSQSGYDLALANYGCTAGLSPQQIVDMIVHHRRIHGKPPRTRLDYFQRTIAKAMARSGRPGAASEVPTPVESSGSATADDPAAAALDAPTARALLCEEIGSIIGVRLLRIIKVTGQQPTYRVELEQASIGFSSVGDLISQGRFRIKIAGAVEHLIPKIKPKDWDWVARMMLKAVTIEDGGDEVDLVGSARMYVRRYLAEAQFINPDTEQSSQTQDKPAVIESSIHIHSFDLQQYINKTFGQNRAVQEVTGMLSALGARNFRLKTTKLRDQSRWALPSSTFPPDQYVRGSGGVSDAASS